MSEPPYPIVAEITAQLADHIQSTEELEARLRKTDLEPVLKALEEIGVVRRVRERFWGLEPHD